MKENQGKKSRKSTEEKGRKIASNRSLITNFFFPLVRSFSPLSASQRGISDPNTEILYIRKAISVDRLSSEQSRKRERERERNRERNLFVLEQEIVLLFVLGVATKRHVSALLELPVKEHL